MIAKALLGIGSQEAGSASIEPKFNDVQLRQQHQIPLERRILIEMDRLVIVVLRVRLECAGGHDVLSETPR